MSKWSTIGMSSSPRLRPSSKAWGWTASPRPSRRSGSCAKKDWRADAGRRPSRRPRADDGGRADWSKGLTMVVAIAGAHGKIAMRLISLLVARGDTVIGLIRNPDHGADVSDRGASPVVCDL